MIWQCNLHSLPLEIRPHTRIYFNAECGATFATTQCRTWPAILILHKSGCGNDDADVVGGAVVIAIPVFVSSGERLSTRTLIRPSSGPTVCVSLTHPSAHSRYRSHVRRSHTHGRDSRNAMYPPKRTHTRCYKSNAAPQLLFFWDTRMATIAFATPFGFCLRPNHTHVIIAKLAEMWKWSDD